MTKTQIILAAHSNHQQIMKELLNDELAKPNISLFPFHVFLSQLTNKEHEAWLFSRAYSMIQKQKQVCTTLSSSLHYPEIIQQLVTFVKECISYEIDIDSLPEQTSKEIDIKHCLRLISSLYKENTTLRVVKDNIHDANNIIIYPFYQTLFDKKIVDYLLSKNAKKENRKSFNDPKKNVYYALNTAREAEAIAQWLNENTHKKTLLVCCETSTLPLMLTTSLSRYNIDYSIDFFYKPSIVVDHFLILYNFYLHKDMDTLKECLSNQVFNNDNYNELLTYINIVIPSYDHLFKSFNHYQNIEQFNTLDKRDQVKLKSLEKQAEKQRIKIQAFLIDNSKHPLLESFEVLTANITNYEPSERQTLFSLKDIVEQMIFSNLEESYQPIVLDYLLSSLSMAKSTKPTNVKITSLRNGYQMGYDCLIIVGANQQNYPGFSKRTGIIDEEYLKLIDYPLLEERLTFHTEQLGYLLESAPEIIVSYATSTFEGKALSESFDLVQNLPRKAWPLSTYGNNKENDYQLSPSIAQKLFFQEDTLFGSVSSFEIFFQCHYRYFLKVGLSLSKNDVEPTLVAMIGTISHAIVEELSKTSTDSFTDTTLKARISYYFDDLHTLYPHQQSYWDFIESRLYNQISLALLRLQETYNHTDFKFFEAEKEFFEVWEISENQKIAIKGFIDRIDMSNDFFRIVDYKSSEKNLSFSKVKAGLQLQLLTYLVIADHAFTQKASGVHYYSFLNKVVDVYSQKVSNYKLITYSENDYQELFFKKHKMSSWFVSDETSMYHSDWFIKHITKTNKISKSGLYDLKKINEFLITIYSSMFETLQKGNISRNPTKDACTYCDFKYICVFKGKYRELEDYQQNNTLKGDDSNA